MEGLNIQCQQPPGDVFPPAVPRVTVSACPVLHSVVGNGDFRRKGKHMLYFVLG